MPATSPAAAAAAAPPPAPSPTLDLVRALLARASVTPQDGGCQDLLAQRLQASGFTAERLDRNGVANLWLRRGRSAPTVVFAGHTDVVPTGPLEQWQSDPFVPTIRDGFLYARGAADMKTSLAAFAIAAEEFVARRPDHGGSIALLLTSDEEGQATDGTVAVVEVLRARREAIDYCIVGEPTCVARLGDTLKNGRRGSLTGRLVVRGIQGHVAYPQLARNPVHDLAPALEDLVNTRWDAGTADFPPTTFQISNIHAGTGAGNVIPGSCTVDFNLRFAPVSSATALQARVEEILFGHLLEFSIAWTIGAQPFYCPAGPLVNALEGAIRQVLGVVPERSTTGGTSDGRFLATICRQVVEFGPPNGSIHKIDECVRLSDVDALKDVYRTTLETLLAT